MAITSMLNTILAIEFDHNKIIHNNEQEKTIFWIMTIYNLHSRGYVQTHFKGAGKCVRHHSCERMIIFAIIDSKEGFSDNSETDQQITSCSYMHSDQEIQNVYSAVAKFSTANPKQWVTVCETLNRLKKLSKHVAGLEFNSVCFRLSDSFILKTQNPKFDTSKIFAGNYENPMPPTKPSLNASTEEEVKQEVSTASNDSESVEPIPDNLSSTWGPLIKDATKPRGEKFTPKKNVSKAVAANKQSTEVAESTKTQWAPVGTPVAASNELKVLVTISDKFEQKAQQIRDEIERVNAENAHFVEIKKKRHAKLDEEQKKLEELQKILNETRRRNQALRKEIQME